MSQDTATTLHVDQGKITRVVLHGRGALVTRQILLPESFSPPTDDDFYTLILRIPSITARADHHQVRARLSPDSPHQILSMQGTWELPEEPESLQDGLGRRIQEIEQRLAHLDRRDKRLDKRRADIDKVHFSPARHRAWLEQGPLTRVEQSLNLSSLLLDYASELDAQHSANARARLELKEELERLTAERAQQSRALKEMERVATTTFVIEIRCAPHQPLLPFELSYVIQDARWWPLYTLRLSEQGKKAELSMEAMIAQDSGEDWEDVLIDLSTADLLLDATLPTLPALKLGKAQPTRRTGFRPPPQDTARLFDAYEQFEQRHHTLFPSTSTPAPPAKPSPMPEKQRELADEPMPSAPPPPQGASLDLARSSRSFSGARREMIMPSSGGAPPMLKKRESNEVTRKRDVLQAFEESTVLAEADFDDFAEDAFDSGPLDISRQWLMYSALQLGEGEARGGLVPVKSAHRPSTGSLKRAVEAASKQALLDPRQTRGHYDYRYTSTARHSIASDGLLHRVDIHTAATSSTLSYQCVPIEAQEVFRLATITNPFAGPMLGGPIDVFIGGSFLLTTTQHHVDQGADFKVGLGAEERIRVARNVRTEEEPLGLLGGKTSILHVITTELTSNLGHDARVQLLERIPIAGDDEIQVKEFEHEPAAAVYHHDEAGLPTLEGGRSWQLTLKPGQTKTITSRYAIILSSKLEVSGGNRRD